MITSPLILQEAEACEGSEESFVGDCSGVLEELGAVIIILDRSATLPD